MLCGIPTGTSTTSQELKKGVTFVFEHIAEQPALDRLRDSLAASPILQRCLVATHHRAPPSLEEVMEALYCAETGFLIQSRTPWEVSEKAQSIHLKKHKTINSLSFQQSKKHSKKSTFTKYLIFVHHFFSLFFITVLAAFFTSLNYDVSPTKKEQLDRRHSYVFTSQTSQKNENGPCQLGQIDTGRTRLMRNITSPPRITRSSDYFEPFPWFLGKVNGQRFRNYVPYGIPFTNYIN